MWPLAFGTMAGALISGGASAFGQHQANKQNVQLTREGMAFEADQVAKQMQFQERMSNTSYQRATEDMRLAGINPMLAFAQGGASTPGGGAASGAAATVQDVAGPAVASAQHARRLGQELKNMYQTERLTSEQTRRTAAEVEESYKRQDLLEIQRKLEASRVPGAERQAEIDRGRGGAAAAWADRIFGGRGVLSPIGLRR